MKTTFTIEVEDAKAIAILKNLEELKLIKLFSKQKVGLKISERLKGKLSATKSEELNRHIEILRSEW